MEQCKICGKKFTKVTVTHIKTHDTDKETYEKLGPYVPPVEKVTVTEKEKKETIFGKPLESIEEPLEKLLREFGISEKELRALIRSYKTGNPIDVVQNIERKQKAGLKKAEALKDKEEVTTSKLIIADALVHNHDFVVTKVTSKPKIWHLRKK